MKRNRSGVAAAAALVALAFALSGGMAFGRAKSDLVFYACAAAQAALAALGGRFAARRGASVVTILVLGAALLRIAFVAQVPTLSGDVYRYIWDGRVIGAGFNPYLHVPADPALIALRDPEQYGLIDKRDYAVTIYPPVAEAIFALVTRISTGVTAMKLVMVLFEAAAVFAVFQLLRRLGKSPGGLVAYLLHPAPIWEIAGNGHVDAAMLAFLYGAFAIGGANRPFVAATAMTLGALAKPTGALGLPALWRPYQVGLPLFVLAMAAALYVPFAAAGTGIVGFLPHYLEEQGLTSGEGVFWLALLRRSGLLTSGITQVFAALTGLALLALALWTRRRGATDLASGLTGTALLLVAFLLAITPTFPWYFLAALPMTPLLGLWSPYFLATGGFLLYGFQSDAPPFFGRWALLVGLALAAAIRDLTHAMRKCAKLKLGAARSGQAAAIDPRRYHEAADPKRPAIARRPPVCLYLEVTNRCNLLCTTCPRTYEALEPPADMTWDLFTHIVGQVPDLARAVLHGVGEPMLVKSLPAMVRHLKERGVYVVFNTNGTALSERNGRALINARLDELRVSLDAATREKFRIVRGADMFNRILTNVGRFRALQVREGVASPCVSLWLTGLKETLAELPAFVRLAAGMGVGEVYLQRLVFFDADPVGLARPNQTLFECLEKDGAEILAEAEAEARRLGVTFSASGAASEPGMSLTPTTRENPWSLCGRPWTLMYFTANGRALPCCIAPFAQHGYENYTLGDATSESLNAIWNGARYRTFRTALQSDRPPRVCSSCGLRWSL